MTVAALAHLMCLASGVFGRPAWSEAKCAAEAASMLAAAERHSVDPVLMLAIDVQECDMRDGVYLDRHGRQRRADNPVFATVRGKKKLVAYDSCPMGLRLPAAERLRMDNASIYERAARKLAAIRAMFPHKKPHHVAQWNPGNPAYGYQVLAFATTLRGRRVPAKTASHLAERTAEIVRRLSLALSGRS